MLRRLTLSAVTALTLALGMWACGDGGCSGIVCSDGWCSHAENRQGACSSHGGIGGGGSVSASPTAPSSSR